ncbi:MAG: hypothetical protein DWQ01_09555 [Planctomycetota bacterium]|nr:MAG: hypothetical protein DWQ01_09555 [Planctomycetota bacterium]
MKLVLQENSRLAVLALTLVFFGFSDSAWSQIHRPKDFITMTFANPNPNEMETSFHFLGIFRKPHSHEIQQFNSEFAVPAYTQANAAAKFAEDMMALDGLNSESCQAIGPLLVLKQEWTYACLAVQGHGMDVRLSGSRDYRQFRIKIMRSDRLHTEMQVMTRKQPREFLA